MKPKTNPTETKTPGGRLMAQLASVVVPGNVTREAYIRTVYETKQVSVLTDAGEWVNKVNVPPTLLQHLVFPKNTPESRTGSMVLIINIIKTNTPVVAQVYGLAQDNPQIFEEGSFEITRYFEGNKIFFTAKAKSGQVLLNIHGEETSELKINVTSPENKAVASVNVAGDININSQGEISVKARKNVKISVLTSEADSTPLDIEIENGLFRVTTPSGRVFEVNDKISLGSSKNSAEPAVLGKKNESVLNELKTILTDLKTAIDIFANTQKGVAQGSLAPLQLGYTTLSKNLGNINAKISNLEKSIPETKSGVVSLD